MHYGGLKPGRIVYSEDSFQLIMCIIFNYSSFQQIVAGTLFSFGEEISLLNIT